MKSNLKSAFLQISKNNCIETIIKERFFIEDAKETGKSYAFYDSERSTSQFFSVINNNLKEINLLQIDNCLFFDSDGEKCDFALFDEKDFIFVELMKRKVKKRRSGIKKATNQLRSTLKVFKENKVDFTNYNLESYVCVGVSGKPSISANKQDLMVAFEEDYNCKLLFDCKKEFK
jgi:hypothetical protein